MLSKISEYASHYKELQTRLESSLIELKDIVQELRILDDEVVHNPAEIEQARSRLDTLYRLQKKHGVETVTALIDIQQDLVKEADQLVHLDETISNLEGEIQETETALTKVGIELSNHRAEVFPLFKKRMEHLLFKLGMPESDLSMTSHRIEPGPFGIDDIRWMFSANKGITAQPIGKVASGGEFSRLMFCVKYLMADKVALPTILFDEIDTGISGEVALQMVEMMHQMAVNHQVITISHLPQFAAKGDHHYYVYKESSMNTTTSGIRKLQGDDRIKEIAKMLGGNNPSEIAYANAKELMQPSN
jgi:DNA repair protein RecN (Recombination protein N)